MLLGDKNGPSADMNVTPLIDVLLVLLIIFMVITPLAPTGLEALIPRPSAEPPQPEIVRDIRTVVLQLSTTSADRPPALKLNDEEVSWDKLQGRLEQIYKLRVERVLFIRGDDDVDFQYVAQAMDAAHSAQVDKVGLITARIEQGRLGQ